MKHFFAATFAITLAATAQAQLLLLDDMVSGHDQFGNRFQGTVNGDIVTLNDEAGATYSGNIDPDQSTLTLYGDNGAVGTVSSPSPGLIILNMDYPDNTE